jgi:hypothetical protein
MKNLLSLFVILIFISIKPAPARDIINSLGVENVSDTLIYSSDVKDKYLLNEKYKYLNLSLSESVLMYFANSQAKKFIELNSNNEEALFRFVDTLTTKYVFSKDKNFILTLNNLFKASDGSLTEYFVSNIEKIIQSNEIEFFKFIYSDRKNSNKNLEKCFVEYFNNLKIDNFTAYQSKKLEISDLIQNLQDDKKLKKYLDKLFLKI